MTEKTKFKAVTWSLDIESVEIERETDKSVWLKGRRGRELKVCDSVGYFDKWEDAKTFLVNIANQKAQDAQRRADYYKKEYDKFKAIQQTKE